MARRNGRAKEAEAEVEVEVEAGQRFHGVSRPRKQRVDEEGAGREESVEGDVPIKAGVTEMFPRPARAGPPWPPANRPPTSRPSKQPYHCGLASTRQNSVSASFPGIGEPCWLRAPGRRRRLPRERQASGWPGQYAQPVVAEAAGSGSRLRACSIGLLRHGLAGLLRDAILSMYLLHTGAEFPVHRLALHHHDQCRQ